MSVRTLGATDCLRPFFWDDWFPNPSEGDTVPECDIEKEADPLVVTLLIPR